MKLRILGTALALLVASGCQQLETTWETSWETSRQTGQPVGAGALFSGLDFTPMVVREEIAMEVATLADIEGHAVNTTMVAYMPDGCEHHQYRTIGGRVSAESICDGARYVSQGRYSVRGDGAYCVEWDNPDWDDSCAAWEYLGNGRFRAGGVDSIAYVGNIFGL